MFDQILYPDYGRITCGHTGTSEARKYPKVGDGLFSPIAPKDEFIQINLLPTL